MLRFVVRWELVLATVALASTGCTDPQFREIACTDGIDQDLDGATDCEDPDCIELTDVCEVTLDRCRDGLDQDRNGATDCEDSRCVEAGHCEPFQVDVCRIVDGEGCPVGMACYSVLGLTRYDCIRPSEAELRGHGDACDPSVPGTSACREGTYCRGLACHQSCRSERDCPVDSVCFRDPATGNGYCTIACDYYLPSPRCLAPGADCGPIQQLVDFDVRNPTFALGACFSAEAFVPGPRGLDEACGPTEEERCANTTPETPGRGLLCVPDAQGVATCRPPCFGSFEDDRFVGSGCDDGSECVPLHPTHPAVLDRVVLQGVCRRAS
jgi:hypothetical protein